MPEALFRPFEIKFEGLDADQQLVDAVYLGESLAGTGRLYNSVVHLYFHGLIQKRPLHRIRMHAGPPGEGSLAYLIWAMMVHGNLPMYPALLGELADVIIPEFVKAVFSRKAGRRAEMDKALEIIHDQAVRHDELAKTVVRDQAATVDRLVGLVERLTNNNSGALAEIAAPVGRSVKQIEHFAKTPDPYIIDEPIAEAFRSAEEAVVGDEQTLRGVLVAVDKVSGTCKIELPDSKKPLRGKITDPQLLVPGNVYTHALDTAQPIELVGKPVTKEGEVSTCYISNATAGD